MSKLFDHRLIVQQLLHRSEQLLFSARERVESYTEPLLLNSLSVVQLVTEQWHHYHGFAEVEGLGYGVVATVSDKQVNERQERYLRYERLSPHVVGQLDLLVFRALGHNEPVLALSQDANESVHHGQIATTNSSHRQVDQLSRLVFQLIRYLKLPDSRCPLQVVESVPIGWKRSDIHVIQFQWVAIDVHEVRVPSIVGNCSLILITLYFNNS